ncbi:hypothetical protein Q8F55_008156 [Vanrija albida]|uniref:Transposase Tc1-like domain-containing protein n=1 Tax=Vanrija albida TaxID=181172 RepID=A0ABR3PVS5_9TREE
MPLPPGDKDALGAYAAHHSGRKAAALWKTSPSTAQRAKVKYLNDESQLPAKPGGRAPKHSKHDLRRIKHILLTNQDLTNERMLHHLAADHHYPMSLSTLRRLRRSWGIVHCRQSPTKTKPA